MLSKKEMKISLEEFRHGFSYELRRLRVDAGLTARELAEKIKLDELTVLRIEMGDEKNVALIGKMAAFYGKRMRLEFI